MSHPQTHEHIQLYIMVLTLCDCCCGTAKDEVEAQPQQAISDGDTCMLQGMPIIFCLCYPRGLSLFGNTKVPLEVAKPCYSAIISRRARSVQTTHQNKGQNGLLLEMDLTIQEGRQCSPTHVMRLEAGRSAQAVSLEAFRMPRNSSSVHCGCRYGQESCLRRMKYSADALQARSQQDISHLRYACRFWVRAPSREAAMRSW